MACGVDRLCCIVHSIYDRASRFVGLPLYVPLSLLPSLYPFLSCPFLSFPDIAFPFLSVSFLSFLSFSPLPFSPLPSFLPSFFQLPFLPCFLSPRGHGTAVKNVVGAVWLGLSGQSCGLCSGMLRIVSLRLAPPVSSRLCMLVSETTCGAAAVVGLFFWNVVLSLRRVSRLGGGSAMDCSIGGLPAAFHASEWGDLLVQPGQKGSSHPGASHEVFSSLDAAGPLPSVRRPPAAAAFPSKKHTLNVLI